MVVVEELGRSTMAEEELDEVKGSTRFTEVILWREEEREQC